MADIEDAPTLQSTMASASTPRTAESSDLGLDFGMGGNGGGYGIGRGDEMNIPQGLDFASDLFGTKEASVLGRILATSKKGFADFPNF